MKIELKTVLFKCFTTVVVIDNDFLRDYAKKYVQIDGR